MVTHRAQMKAYGEGHTVWMAPVPCHSGESSTFWAGRRLSKHFSSLNTDEKSI